MAEANSATGGRAGAIEKVKTGAAVLGALAGAITALYGVYEKVRAEAKQDTAASYNTLAPQMNQLGDALKQLQQENQQLRDIVADYQGKPRIATRPAPIRKPTTPRKPNAGATGGAAAPEQAPAGAPTGQATGAPAAEPPGQPATPPAEAPPGTAPQSGTAEAPHGTDPIGGLLNTVGRTRDAIESLRKVPEDFEKVVGKKKGGEQKPASDQQPAP